MKKFIFASITAFLCTMLTASATWEITSTSGNYFEVSDGTWTIKCEKTDNNGGFRLLSWIAGADAELDLISLNSDIDTDEIDYSLKGIFKESLRNRSITGIKIPKTLTYIDSYAFNSSNGYLSGDVVFEEGSMLTSLGQQCFQNSKITSINLNVCTELKSMGANLFAGCSNLKSIGTGEIPASVTSVGAGLFSGCSALAQDIYSDAKFDFSGKEIFKKSGVTSVILPNVYGSVGTYCFNDAKSLKKVVLNSSMTGFSQQAFCASSIEILEPKKFPNLTFFGSTLFSGSSNLSSPLDFSKSTFTSIPTHAFASCNSLTEIRIPATVTSIDSYAFKQVKKADIYFYGNPPSVTSGSFQAFDGKSRCNIKVFQENVVAWTNNTVANYTFTPLSEVNDSEKTVEYCYPENSKVLGKIAIGTSPVGTHWLSLIPELGTIVVIH